MLVVTIFWLPVLIIPLVTPVHGTLAITLETIDYMVWALFALEYLIKMAIVPDRVRYFKTHLLGPLDRCGPIFPTATGWAAWFVCCAWCGWE